MSSPPPHLLASMHDLAGIQYGRFRLMDWDDTAGIPDNFPQPERNTQNSFVKSKPNFAHIQADFDNHVINVWFELWDGPAPSPVFLTEAVNVKTWTGTFYASSEKVYAVELVDSREALRIFDLGKTEAIWQMRVILRALVDKENIWDSDE